ncbi:hypothetical protein HSRCO_0518 [Halanaeroarchaeum sp. HSR-CO]|uniref:hypothetical protein n=1 Tax=Halanaeroarchaeum sp. HSR-CO TaxID=2866382 RepID=UPI00217D1135|nr:hypothetical protein [Halanaeroarchaeum sp. HSR-CO]UWG46814.1 hypothetical protein HSRCO_0518 [Halanaeroarchaeum sp. HSR-CO]
MSSEKIDSEDDTGPGANTTRRKLMAAGAASWATVGLAGCSGNGGDPTEEPTDEPTTAEPQPEDFVVTEDMQTGSDGIPATAGFVSACSPTRTFSPGMLAVWNVGIYDPETGDVVDDAEIESVQVTMSSSDVAAADGESVEITWAGDEDENPHDWWNGAWTVPEDAAAGTVEYTVEISTTGAGTNLVGVSANSFEIVEFQDNYVVSAYPKSVSDNSTDGYQNGCGPEWQFAPGETVHFVAEVFNPREGGTHLGPDSIESATLSFPDGEFDDIEMGWPIEEDAEDVEEGDRVWEAALQLPEDTEAGSYDFEVTVEPAEGGADGLLETTSTISNFNVIEV